jgi:hypothetical protein
MRIVIAIISIVAALALVGTAAATPNKTTQINTVLVGDGCDFNAGFECGSGGGGSCVCEDAYWNFAGSTNISPPLGALSFTGHYEEEFLCGEIGTFFDCLVPLTYIKTLILRLTARNGDRLVIAEHYVSTTQPPFLMTDSNPVQGEWTVDPDQSSGRFARYTGSGTYTLGYESHYTTATFTIALTGSLTLH